MFNDAVSCYYIAPVVDELSLVMNGLCNDSDRRVPKYGEKTHFRVTFSTKNPTLTGLESNHVRYVMEIITRRYPFRGLRPSKNEEQAALFKDPVRTSQ